MLLSLPRLPLRTAALPSTSFLSASMAASKAGQAQPSLPVRSYVPHNSSGPFPYSAQDLAPQDPGNDKSFYALPRFVTHIDDNAIATLRKYYADTLPRKGSILDFCSSWISHYPVEVEEAQKSGQLQIFGTGMNMSELSRNPVLTSWAIQDLNDHPDIKLPQESGKLDAATCVVSIDYLSKPVEVLQSIRQQSNVRGMVHLVISNRCFPTKAAGRWLKVSEPERLEMVGDYLWWSGWRDIEIVEVVKGTWMKDPLWVVRGANSSEGEEKLGV